jgi:hypothetical protein
VSGKATVQSLRPKVQSLAGVGRDFGLEIAGYLSNRRKIPIPRAMRYQPKALNVWDYTNRRSHFTAMNETIAATTVLIKIMLQFS